MNVIGVDGQIHRCLLRKVELKMDTHTQVQMEHGGSALVYE
jgi:hypothetical protein